MFVRLLKWFLRKFDKSATVGVEYSLSVYKPIERNIYTYFNGKDTVSVDPMVIFRKISDNEHALRSDIMASSHKEYKGSDKARQELLNTIRKIFDVKPFDQGGLTEEETYDLFNHYIEFESVQKKIVETSPTITNATSTELPKPSGESSTTQNTSGSNSTPAAPFTDKRESSPTEQESPSVPLTPVSTTT